MKNKTISNGQQPSGHNLFKELTLDELRLHEEKNKDYRSKGDALANFKRVAGIMALYPDMQWATPEGVAILYSLKQFDACLSLLERNYEGGVENVDTRARDVSVYWKILRILHRERKVKPLDRITKEAYLAYAKIAGK